MKALPLAMMGLLATALGQRGPAPVDLFRTVRPQIAISVRRDPNGSRADLVEATSIDANYPPDQLAEQVIKLGELIGSQPRGLSVARHSVSGADGRFTSVKASFAVDNLIDRATGHLHLTEIARAFAGAAEPHRVTGLSLSFVGEIPTENTLLAFGSESDPVQIQGDFNPSFKSTEYRVKLNSQDPKAIFIPESKEQIPVKTPSTHGNPGPDLLFYGLIIVAAVAAGALVYSVLVRITASKRS